MQTKRHNLKHYIILNIKSMEINSCHLVQNRYRNANACGSQYMRMILRIFYTLQIKNRLNLLHEQEHIQVY